MTLILSPPALASLSSSKPQAAQAKKLNSLALPDSIIAELKAFAKRNDLGKQHYCMHCLKAHAYSIGKAHLKNEGVIAHLLKTLPGDVGHNRYYTDVDKLCNVGD